MGTPTGQAPLDDFQILGYNLNAITKSPMHISWLGGTTIRLQTKPNEEDIVVLIDPYRPEAGTFPRSLAPQVAVCTRGEDGLITLSGNPFLLATSGECETKDILISAVFGDDDRHLLVRLDTEGIALGHLGLSKKPLTNAQLELIGGVDVLFLPVGGSSVYDAEAAVKVVNAIEPRVVIPIAFQSDNDPRAQSVEGFLREMGVKTEKPQTKIILKKKDLPQEETQVILLEKE